MSRPFAVFDIDGTIIRWQLYHALADELAQAGRVDQAKYQQVREARLAWKHRADSAAFDDYELRLIAMIEDSTQGLSVEIFEEACRAVLTKYKDQVYAYTRDLIAELRAKNYLLFAISASQAQIVGLVADYYGFDDFGGSTYEVKGGKFTGRSQILKHERKPEFLKSLVQKHGANWQDSIGVGDSDGDIPMLSAVEKPIAFNPTQVLFEHARQQRWKIVLERKNMVYELEPQDESYLLAQTNAR